MFIPELDISISTVFDGFGESLAKRDGLARPRTGPQVAPCMNVTAALGIADYGSFIETNRIVLQDTAEALQNDEEVKEASIST